MSRSHHHHRGRFFGGGCLGDFAGSIAGRREPGKGLPRRMRMRLHIASYALSSAASAIASSRASFSQGESSEPAANAAL